MSVSVTDRSGRRRYRRPRCRTDGDRVHTGPLAKRRTDDRTGAGSTSLAPSGGDPPRVLVQCSSPRRPFSCRLAGYAATGNGRDRRPARPCLIGGVAIGRRRLGPPIPGPKVPGASGKNDGVACAHRPAHCPRHVQTSPDRPDSRHRVGRHRLPRPARRLAGDDAHRSATDRSAQPASPPRNAGRRPARPDRSPPQNRLTSPRDSATVKERPRREPPDPPAAAVRRPQTRRS